MFTPLSLSEGPPRVHAGGPSLVQHTTCPHPRRAESTDGDHTMTINSDSTPHSDLIAAALANQLKTVASEAAAFRDLVRDRAIQGYHDLDWSLDEMNDRLRELGLGPHEPRTVTQADLGISMTVTADTDDEHIGTAAMQHLTTPEGEQVMRTAINRALQTLNGTGPALSVHGTVNSVSLDTASLQTA